MAIPIFQTGINHNINRNTVSYDVWIEWFPAFTQDFSSIGIRAEEGNSPVLLSDFHAVTSTGVSAGSTSLSGATLINMEQNERILTSASISGSTVTVRYTGPSTA
ncbi:hypothetical protein K488DRAFT_83582 [Vararia minispora EC-137]|uniref:Uncharacterized protein n=1 Tax=Vararia minispora EC-137 TaxID=1314806 RepID=A0ACB8QT33_9AGAM|nr:hypothetical protein K488DRAFT_83582 [Vararia minispora EC-137]